MAMAPQGMDPQTRAKIIAEAARLGLSPEAYMRIATGAARPVAPPAQMPQQRPFAQGVGPGGGYGGGQQASTGIGAQIAPASYQGQVQPAESDPSIWARLKTGIGLDKTNPGVPFGQRIGNVGAILSALADPQGRALSPTLVAVGDRNAEAQNLADQKTAYYAEQEKQQQMAQRLYENLKDTNPQMAEMILANPALVKNYMEGQLDIEKVREQEGIRTAGAKELQGIQDTAAMDRLRYQTENNPASQLQTQQDTAAMDRLRYSTDNDPATIREQKRIDAENNRWDDFLQREDLVGASTLEIYRKKFKDDALTENEAQRLASEHMRDGEKGLNEEYARVIDDRTKKGELTLAENAAKQAGIDIPQGMQLVNADDVFKKNKKPILEWMQGTKQWEAAQAAKRNSKKAAGSVVSAIDRVQDRLKKQASGENLTGAGWTGVLAQLPGEHGAGEIAQDLNVINSNMGFQTIQENRSATTGGFLGQVSNWENVLTQSTHESLNQTRDPQFFSDQLSRLRKMYSGMMTQSSVDPYKSTLQADAEALMSDPSPDAIAEFNNLWGEGMAEKVIEMGPAGAEPYAGQ